VKNLSLDIGCGWNKKFQRRRGEIGVDIVKGLCTVQADACHLPFRDKVFDKIYLFDILEHLENPLLCLREAHRVAADDATVLIRFPVNANIPRVELKRIIIGFPFGFISTVKLLLRRRWMRKIKGANHVSQVKPEHIARFFTIERQARLEKHEWFMGRKGKILSKLLNGFVMRAGYNWTIKARKEL